MDQEFVTMSEAAEILSVSMLTMRRKVQQFKLEVFTNKADTRKKLLRRSEVEALKTEISPLGELVATLG